MSTPELDGFRLFARGFVPDSGNSQNPTLEEYWVTEGGNYAYLYPEHKTDFQTPEGTSCFDLTNAFSLGIVRAEDNLIVSTKNPKSPKDLISRLLIYLGPDHQERATLSGRQRFRVPNTDKIVITGNLTSWARVEETESLS